MNVTGQGISDAFLRLDPDDNVAIVRAALLPQTAIGDLVVREPIPALHKIALRDIAAGDRVVKFRHAIGIATEDIPAGAHVHCHNCAIGAVASSHEHAATPTARPDPIPVESTATFQGYRRSTGKVGTRNFIGVLTSVNCSATAARRIADWFDQPDALADYPNVDGVVALAHGTGCGMRASGEGFETLQRVLGGYARHPNFGGVLLIGLGCEVMQIRELMQEWQLPESETFRAFTIQESGGSRRAVEEGVAAVKAMLPAVNAQQRETVPAGELVLALQCGGSDALSGITANPALGVATDLLVRQGGTAILSETPELYGAEHLLLARATDESVAEALMERIRWWEAYAKLHGAELDNNPSPGNKAGGLTTIIEKSLGAIAKGGSSPLCGVYRYGEPIDRRGLVVMDSPGFDPVSVTGQVASGATVVCFTTGRGSTFGFKPSPTLKLATNTTVYNDMIEDMDINCGDILDGDSDVERKGAEIFQAILATASGSKTKSESLDYGDNEFTPWQIGSVM